MEIYTIKVPAYWVETPENLGRLAAKMVERWRGSVERHPDFKPFKMMLQVWRDIQGSPAYFIASGIVIAR